MAWCRNFAHVLYYRMKYAHGTALRFVAVCYESLRIHALYIYPQCCHIGIGGNVPVAFM